MNGGCNLTSPPCGQVSAKGVTVADQHVPVLVVGGSLVGLSTSLLLATAGVPHLLVERHRGTAVHPRAASFHQRTMEIFRSLGVQPAVEAAAEKEFVQNGAIVSVQKLAADRDHLLLPELQRGRRAPQPDGAAVHHPDRPRAAAARHAPRSAGRRTATRTELVDFEQDDDGVTAVMRSRDGGAEETVRADYLVAADGAHSLVRERSGIEMTGRGAFARCVTIYFRADMRELIGDRNLSVVYVNHPELLGFFRFSLAGRRRLPRRLLDDRARRQPRHPRGRGPDPGALRRPRAQGARPARPGGRRRQRPALVGGGVVGGPLPGPAGVPGRRRGARHAADRWLRGQHRGRGRARPRLEARRWWRTARREPRCSTPTTPSADRWRA